MQQQSYNRNQAGYQQEQAHAPVYETEHISSSHDPQQYEQQYYHPAQPGAPGTESTPPLTEHAYLPDQSSTPFFYAPYGRSEAGVDGKLAAALCYVGFWLTGLLFILFVRDNKFIRFHAMQSLLFFGAVNVLFIALISVFSRHVFFFHFINGFAILAFVLMNSIATVAWVVGLVGALSGKYTRLPFVSDYAERFANKGASVK